MGKRKVAVSHNIRVNVGNYQHIDSTFYAEEEIEYNSQEERVALENAVNDEVVEFLIRAMRALPEKLGKKTEAVQEVEESIKKAVPEWLSKDPIPNLANKAKSNHDKVVAEQKDAADSAVEKSEDKVQQVATDPEISATESTTKKSEEVYDLFSDD